MIVDKKKPIVTDTSVVSAQSDELFDEEPLLPDSPNVTIEEVELNPLEEVYSATRRVLEAVMDPDTPTQWTI